MKNVKASRRIRVKRAGRGGRYIERDAEDKWSYKRQMKKIHYAIQVSTQVTV